MAYVLILLNSLKMLLQHLPHHLHAPLNRFHQGVALELDLELKFPMFLDYGLSGKHRFFEVIGHGHVRDRLPIKHNQSKGRLMHGSEGQHVAQSLLNIENPAVGACGVFEQPKQHNNIHHTFFKITQAAALKEFIEL